MLNNFGPKKYQNSLTQWIIFLHKFWKSFVNTIIPRLARPCIIMLTILLIQIRTHFLRNKSVEKQLNFNNQFYPKISHLTKQRFQITLMEHLLQWSAIIHSNNQFDIFFIGCTNREDAQLHYSCIKGVLIEKPL